MKDILRILILDLCAAGAIAIVGWMPVRTTELPASLTPEEISWVEFSKYYGYDVHTEDDEIITEFLDTWCGSTVEEEALTRNGVES